MRNGEGEREREDDIVVQNDVSQHIEVNQHSDQFLLSSQSLSLFLTLYFTETVPPY